MNIDMTKTLRELRKQKNVTQEQLANFLGITPQSVGKWERGGYPDITLLPKIALYFNVTVDTLLGVDEARIKEAIEGYEKESKRLSNIGDVEVELKLWEKAYEECLTALDNMKKHAIIADTQPDFKHTSFIVNKTYYPNESPEVIIKAMLFVREHGYPKEVGIILWFDFILHKMRVIVRLHATK